MQLHVCIIIRGNRKIDTQRKRVYEGRIERFLEAGLEDWSDAATATRSWKKEKQLLS